VVCGTTTDGDDDENADLLLHQAKRHARHVLATLMHPGRGHVTDEAVVPWSGLQCLLLLYRRYSKTAVLHSEITSVLRMVLDTADAYRLTQTRRDDDGGNENPGSLAPQLDDQVEPKLNWKAKDEDADTQTKGGTGKVNTLGSYTSVVEAMASQIRESAEHLGACQSEHVQTETMDSESHLRLIMKAPRV
jgi:hypothetical protein